MSNRPLIELEQVSKQYALASGSSFTALSRIDLCVYPAEFVAILGKSGSGKSTLLNLIAALDRPSNGEIRITGESLRSMSEDQLARWRGRNVGVVFQFFQLLPTLTIAENLLLAMDFHNVVPRPQRKKQALHLLERVGIPDQADKLPAALSGGQQQRAAVARALANDPPLLVADEPTGNLDSQTTASLLSLFDELTARGKTLLVVTHDAELAQRASRVVRLADGKIVSDEKTIVGGER